MINQILRLPLRLGTKILWLGERALIRAGSHNRFLAGLYYTIFNHCFIHEQMAILAGRLAYNKSLLSPNGSIALLRRNVHRIEKGIIMRPRRVPFALDYIEETVNAFVLSRSMSSIDSSELRWASDVLSEYFSICSSSSESLCNLRAIFNSAAITPFENTELQIPYKRDLSSPSPVDLDSLMALAIRRRSVRWFLKNPVPRSMIEGAIELAGLGPSACNRQPFEFRVFDDAELVQKIIRIPFGLAGYGHNVPCIIVIVGKYRNYFSERDRHLIYIDSSLAAMGLLFGLEAQGLSSCCVNWPEVDDQNILMSGLLHLDSDERPTMLIAIGFPDPDGLVPRSTKKSLSFMRRYNFE